MSCYIWNYNFYLQDQLFLECLMMIQVMRNLKILWPLFGAPCVNVMMTVHACLESVSQARIINHAVCNSLHVLVKGYSARTALTVTWHTCWWRILAPSATPLRNGRRFYSQYVQRSKIRTSPPWRMVFFGTDDYALPHLKKLNENRYLLWQFIQILGFWLVTW